MAYTKTITINNVQDLFLQNNLQEYKNTNWDVREEQTSSVADQILAILETSPEANNT
jgi:hypothetical protein